MWYLILLVGFIFYPICLFGFLLVVYSCYLHLSVTRTTTYIRMKIIIIIEVKRTIGELSNMLLFQLDAYENSIRAGIIAERFINYFIYIIFMLYIEYIQHLQDYHSTLLSHSYIAINYRSSYWFFGYIRRQRHLCLLLVFSYQDYENTCRCTHYKIAILIDCHSILPSWFLIYLCKNSTRLLVGSNTEKNIRSDCILDRLRVRSLYQ